MDAHTSSQAIIHTMIEILSCNPQYGIQPAILSHLHFLQNADIYTFSEVSEKTIIKSYDGTDAAVYTLQKSYPQAIDPLPLRAEGQITPLRPALLLPDNCITDNEKWIITHEICHLFSIGAYTADAEKQEIYHTYGLNQYHYDMSMHIISEKIYRTENEKFNDAVTWYFLEQIKGGNVEPVSSYIRKYCYSIKERKDIQKLIGYYFSGQVEQLIAELNILS